MASRHEEKESRRQARLEQEAAERRAAAYRKRLQLVLGGILGVGIVVGIVVAVLAGTGGDRNSMKGAGAARQAAESGVKLPPQQESDLTAAVKASGCVLQHPKDEGRGHDDREFTAADYGTNPPTSGIHHPLAAQDGIYDPGNSPALGQSTHALEHGRVLVQYKPGTDAELIKQLEAFVGENQGYHMLLFENTTDMEPQIAVTAWDQLLQCPKPNDRMWDAMRAFRDRYMDKAPENIP
jgi:hypothetical protein